MRSWTWANVFICWLDHADDAPLANIKMECQRWLEKPLILGKSWTQYVGMVTALLNSYCGAHLVESYCQESNISDRNWLRYLSSSHLVKILLSYDIITSWLICKFWKLDYLWNKTGYLNKSKQRCSSHTDY